MNATLARYLKTSGQKSRRPSMQELLACLDDPERDPQVTLYLDRHPELRATLRQIVQTVLEDSYRAIQLAAYFLFKQREQRGERPLEGRDWEDWFAAEKALRQHSQQREHVNAA